MKRNIIKIFVLLISSISLFSCKDKFDLNLDNSFANQITVDAFINNKAEKQKIYIRKSVDFSSDANIDSNYVTTAQVWLKDLTDGSIDSFYIQPRGFYQSLKNGDSICQLNHEYEVYVQAEGELYVAKSKMNRVVPIDSIRFSYNKKSGSDSTFTAEYYARDAVGLGDVYWQQHYRNDNTGLYPDTLNRNPQLLQPIYDASGSPASLVDGLIFIFPIRVFALNDKAYRKGHILRVELHSITAETAEFLSRLSTQLSTSAGSGASALFQEPVANVPTNIKNANPNSKIKAIGFFCVSAVSTKTEIVRYNRPERL